LIDQIGFGSNDKEGLDRDNGRQQRKTEIAPVSNIGHPCFQHLPERFLFIRLAAIHQEVSWDHTVQLKAQM
jgi:hypothetical protein